MPPSSSFILGFIAKQTSYDIEYHLLRTNPWADSLNDP